MATVSDSIETRYKVGDIVTCIKGNAKLFGKIQSVKNSSVLISWNGFPHGIWYTRQLIMSMGILVGEPSGTPNLSKSVVYGTIDVLA